jgi:hypothetical protein
MKFSSHLPILHVLCETMVTPVSPSAYSYESISAASRHEWKGVVIFSFFDFIKPWTHA